MTGLPTEVNVKIMINFKLRSFIDTPLLKCCVDKESTKISTSHVKLNLGGLELLLTLSGTGFFDQP